MFGNFIYFIVVLLIYLTYQPPDKTSLPLTETLMVFAVLLGLFYWLVRFSFRKLQKQATGVSLASLDYRLSAIQGRLSVLAIILFTLNIYGLNLPSFLKGLPIIDQLPTLGAVLFITLFVSYLVIIWHHAHPVGRMIGGLGESRRTFIWSNIAFSVPALIPWFIISLITDLLSLLPFAFIRSIQNNPAGQLAFFIVLLLAIAIAAPAMIQRFWGCRPLETGIHRNRIEALCQRAQVAYAEILNWPIFGGRMLTAGVMGLVRRFRYILVTDALLQHLSFEEIDTVIAHEIGHVKKYHIQLYMLLFLGFLLFFFSLQDILLFIIIYNAYILLSAGIINSISNPAIYAVFNVAFITMFLLYFRYLFGFFVRNFERQADAYVFNLLPSAFPLIRSLEKVSLTSGQSPDKPNWHHFSITERIQFLKSCETDRQFVKRHDKKIKKSLWAYTLILIVIASAGWFITPQILNNKLTNSFHEKLLVLQIEKSPGNAALYFDLANVRLSKQKYREAIFAYKQAVWLNPKFPLALNNLAWLYATCEDESLRDPHQALKLALTAANLLPRAHILDTLAESYYVNGQVQEALLAGKQALQAAEENRDYYLKQVQRFEKALKGIKMQRPEVGQD
jgi:Zn-dependent protease with chaperone function